MIHLTIIKEDSGAPRGSGVYTAFVQLLEALRRRDDVRVSVNSIPPDTDVIHAHTTMWRYLLASLRHRDKLMVSAHEVPDTYLGSFVFDRASRRVAAHYLRFVYNRARLVVAVSPYTREELIALGVRSEIAVLCNGVDRTRFKPDGGARARLRRSLGLGPCAFVVMNAAQVQPRKGVRMFVEVARQVPEASFVWVGGRPYGRLSADYDACSRLMCEAPANVCFTGQVDYADMPGYYAMADACLFPSIQECFGYTIVEAAATGLPVMLIDNPAYRGYLFDDYLAASAPEGFAAHVRRLMSDEAFREEWKARGAHLAQRHDLATYPDRLMALYRRVAGRP